jgi:hypothetical protein
MVATTTIRRRQPKHQNHSKIYARTTAIDYAVRVIYRVCCLAGSASLIDNIRADLDAEGVRAAMKKARHRGGLRLADRSSQLPRHRGSDRLRLHGAARVRNMGRYQSEPSPFRHVPQAHELLALS